MPLFNVCGVTNLDNKAFAAAVGFTSGEKEADYQWLFGALREMQQQYGIAMPQAVVKDRVPGMYACPYMSRHTNRYL